MENDKTGNEPQSYGNDAEWVTGKTGQNVNDPKAAPPNSQHGDFYESRHDSEGSAPDQGGKVSGLGADEPRAGNASGQRDSRTPIQADESTGRKSTDSSQSAATESADQPVKKVTGAEGGAVRDSFFKDRDYE